MKKSRNMKLVGEVVDILKKEGKEPTHSAASQWVMSNYTTHYGAKYGHLKQGDFALYFREFYGKSTESIPE